NPGLPVEDDLEAFSDVGGISHGSLLGVGRDLSTYDDVRARLVSCGFAFGGDLKEEASFRDGSADPAFTLEPVSLHLAERPGLSGGVDDPRDEARGVRVDVLGGGQLSQHGREKEAVAF